MSKKENAARYDSKTQSQSFQNTEWCMVFLLASSLQVFKSAKRPELECNNLYFSFDSVHMCTVCLANMPMRAGGTGRSQPHARSEL